MHTCTIFIELVKYSTWNKKPPKRFFLEYDNSNNIESRKVVKELR